MSQRLSARQEECLRLTAFLTDKEIAARLGLSEATVKKHVHEGCRRLGVNRRKAALAILERNVPEPTKDPMAKAAPAGVSGSDATETDNAISTHGASPLDLGRSGSGAQRVQPLGAKRSGAGASDARADGRRATGDAARTAAAGPERGLGDGPGGGPERRLGYRPPPRSWVVRLLILLVLVVVTAVMMKAVADLVLAYAGQAQEIGHVTNPELIESGRTK
jgi:DNA-binding CsgD family transcriptional regulator